MPQDFVATAILKTVRSVSGYPKLSVLDLSCGRGEILSAVTKDGCNARGTRYRSDDYKLTQQTTTLHTIGLQIDDGVDLTKPLPYESASFDLVVLSEVIEHLESFMPIVREIGRVLRPGGHFVMSTPNMARLHSRLHFLLTGTHKLIRRRVGWDLEPDDLYAYHINPVDFPLLHTLLHQSGMHVRALNFTRFKLRHSWLLLAYPLVWLATQLSVREKTTSEEHALGERDLRYWMTTPAMLASEQLLVVARKATHEGARHWSPRETRNDVVEHGDVGSSRPATLCSNSVCGEAMPDRRSHRSTMKSTGGPV